MSISLLYALFVALLTGRRFYCISLGWWFRVVITSDEFWNNTNSCLRPLKWEGSTDKLRICKDNLLCFKQKQNPTSLKRQNVLFQDVRFYHNELETTWELRMLRNIGIASPADSWMSLKRKILRALKLDVFSDEVFVFTPKGDVTNLPKGSIPIDFAYRIHTEVGNRCVGAKINNKIVPLDTKLKNGDIVSIITSKTGKPSYDWINMVGAADSKAKIRSWFKKENKPENIARGQELLIQEADRLGFEWKKLTQKNRLEDIAKTFNNITEEDLLASVGYGGIPSKSVILKLAEVYKKELNAQKNTAQKTAKDLENLKMRSVKTRSNSGILVKGEEGLVVHLAKCCNPVPGDNIVGFVTRGRGVSVHCVDCPNAVNFPDKDRMIDVSWEDQSGGVFLVTIEVISYDRTGLMADILAALTEMKLSVSSANVKVENSGMAVMNLGIQIKDLQQLDYIMTKVRRIKGVHSVRRMRSAQQGGA